MRYPEINTEAKYHGLGDISIPVIFITKDGNEYKGVFDFDSKEWVSEDAEYFSKKEVVGWRAILSKKRVTE